MQLTTDQLERGDTQQAAPKSPGSPFSAKQRRWSGIVQQVQDSSARLNLRRRQSTEAAEAAAGGPAHYGFLQQPAHAGAPGSAQSSVLQDNPTAGLHASSARQPAAAGRHVPISSPTNPLLPPSKAATGEPSRWTSLKQRLREVKHGRQNCSNSRASSTIADSSDASSVVSEGSSIVEVKLERLLLQVATKPCTAGCTEKRPAPSPFRGLGVTVRRFTPPAASTSSMTPDTLQAPIHHAASSPTLSTAATPAPAAATTAAVIPSSQLSPLEHNGSLALQVTEAAAAQLQPTPAEPLLQQQQPQLQPQQQLQKGPWLLPTELQSPAPAVSLQQQQQQQNAVRPSLFGSSSSGPAVAAAAVATSVGVSGTASSLAAPAAAAAAALARCAGDTACKLQEAKEPLWLSSAVAAAAAATTAGAEPQAVTTVPAAAEAAAGTYTGGSQAGFGSCMPGMLSKRPTLLLTELHAAVGVSDIAPPPAAAAPAAGEARIAEVSASYGMDRSGLSCTLSATSPEVTALQDSAAGHSMLCRKPPSLLLPGQQTASGGACDCAAPAAAVEAGPGSSCRRPSLVLSQQQQPPPHAAGQDPAGLSSSSPPGSSDGSAVQLHNYSTGACVGDSITAVPTAVASGYCQGAILHSSVSAGIPAGGLAQPSGYNPTSRPPGLEVLQHDGLLAQHPQQQQQQQQRHHSLLATSNSGAAPYAAVGAGPSCESVATAAAAAAAAANTLLQGPRAQPATSQVLAGRSPLYCSYSSAADVFNNADIQQLLHRVEACMGPARSAADAAAADAGASASDAVDGLCRPAEQASTLLGDSDHTATRLPQQQQQKQQSLLSENLEASFDSFSGSSTGCKPRPASGDGHPGPTGSSSRSISSMPKRPSILVCSAAQAGEAEAEPGQLQEVLGSDPGASSPTPKSTGRRLMQRHVSWKAEVDVLLGVDAAPQGLNDPAEQEGTTSGVSAHRDHKHGQSLQQLSSHTQQSDVTSKPAAEHYRSAAGTAYTRNSLAGAAAAAPSSAAAAAACDGGFGGVVSADRALPDAAGSSGWRPRLGSSWDGAVVQPRGVAAAAAGAGAAQGLGHGMAVAAAAAPSATLVVPLSSAALALAADLEHQQQQQQRSGVGTEQPGCEITLSGASAFASGQLQHLPARQSLSSGGGQVQRAGHSAVAAAQGFKPARFKAVSTAGTFDDGVSCCGSSELSAMGNPLAYADSLKQRMGQHLGGNLSSSSSRSRSMSGSGLRPAAAGAEEEERATAGAPLAAVTLLEQYLDEHQVLKQKAARLKQNLTQRQQLKEQHHKHSAFAANHASPLQLRHTFSPLAASQGSKQNRWQGSFSGIRQDITSTANRRSSQPTKPEQLVQGRLYTSDKIRTAPAEDPCGLNVDELRQDLELVLKRV